MPIPDSALADVPELNGRITQPEDSRMWLPVADLDRVDDLARKQNRAHRWRLSNEALEESRRNALAGRLAADLWVFGYGSLIWDPGLNTLEIRRARVTGYFRRFCLSQTFGRGSIEHPGMMLALDSGCPDDVCDAVAMRIPAERVETESGFV